MSVDGGRSSLFLLGYIESHGSWLTDSSGSINFSHWMSRVSVVRMRRIQKHPDKCRRGLREMQYTRVIHKQTTINLIYSGHALSYHFALASLQACQTKETNRVNGITWLAGAKIFSSPLQTSFFSFIHLTQDASNIDNATTRFFHQWEKGLCDKYRSPKIYICDGFKTVQRLQLNHAHR